jgi:gluconolactonase
MVNITHVNLLTLAASIPYANELYGIANASTDHISFLSYSEYYGVWLEVSQVGFADSYA